MGFTDRSRGKQVAADLWVKLFRLSTQGGITALAGGGKLATTPKLTYGYNRISVCATAADSACLPAWQRGAVVVLVNDGAAACQVFGQFGSTDTIDAIATATGVPLTNATRSFYFAGDVAGNWYSGKMVKSS